MIGLVLRFQRNKKRARHVAKGSHERFNLLPKMQLLSYANIIKFAWRSSHCIKLVLQGILLLHNLILESVKQVCTWVLLTFPLLIYSNCIYYNLDFAIAEWTINFNEALAWRITKTLDKLVTWKRCIKSFHAPLLKSFRLNWNADWSFYCFDGKVRRVRVVNYGFALCHTKLPDFFETENWFPSIPFVQEWSSLPTHTKQVSMTSTISFQFTETNSKISMEEALQANILCPMVANCSVLALNYTPRIFSRQGRATISIIKICSSYIDRSSVGLEYGPPKRLTRLCFKWLCRGTKSVRSFEVPRNKLWQG